MRISELFRLVWLNINQNKFKSVMTSIGIVVGAATIVMVIGIGRGGQMDIADQFAELNAGAIDVSYEYAGEEAASGKSGGFFTGGMMNAVFGHMMGGGQGGIDPAGNRMQRPNDSDEEEIQRPDGQNSNGENADETESETSMIEDRLNQEQIILNASDVDDIETYVTGITGATISYSTRSSVEGGELTSAQTYTVAGVLENFAEAGKLSLSEGYFLDEIDNNSKSKVCIIGSSVAKEVFGSVADGYLVMQILKEYEPLKNW